MRKSYSRPQADILLISIEEGTCLTASAAENEGFTPVPGVWDTPVI